jgi:hypothetical protein
MIDTDNAAFHDLAGTGAEIARILHKLADDLNDRTDTELKQGRWQQGPKLADINGNAVGKGDSPMITKKALATLLREAAAAQRHDRNARLPRWSWAGGCAIALATERRSIRREEAADKLGVVWP